MRWQCTIFIFPVHTAGLSVFLMNLIRSCTHPKAFKLQASRSNTLGGSSSTFLSRKSPGLKFSKTHVPTSPGLTSNPEAEEGTPGERNLTSLFLALPPLKIKTRQVPVSREVCSLLPFTPAHSFP